MRFKKSTILDGAVVNLLFVYIIILKATNTFLILLSHARHLPSLDEKMVDTVQEPFSFFFDELTHLRKHGLESPVFAKVSSQPSIAVWIRTVIVVLDTGQLCESSAHVGDG
jgi:hypothetical protein